MTRPDDIRQYLSDLETKPTFQAIADQRAAQLNETRREGTWLAVMALLAEVRNAEVPHAVALQNLKYYLHQLDHDGLVILTTYLLQNTVFIVSKYEDGGDMVKTILGMVGSEGMERLEKFVATEGQSCPSCGGDDGFSEHDCDGLDDHECTSQCFTDHGHV